MTDGQGRTVDFRNTILIMTSNVGSDWILTETDEERMRDKVMEAVRSTFKPEFLNRVDDIVVFHRLSRQEIGEIVELQVAQLAQRLAKRNLTLEVTEEARAWLADKGYDPSFGARPLRRLVQKDLADGIALALLKGDYREGDCVQVSLVNGSDLIFRRMGAAQQ